MKIVIDSNIFASSFFWGGNPQKVFDRVINGLDELFITDEIMTLPAASSGVSLSVACFGRSVVLQGNLLKRLV